MNPFDRNSIGKLEKKLYSRSKPQEYADTRAELSESKNDVDTKWEGGESVESLVQKSREEREHAQGKVFKKILIGSIAFFLLALGAAAFLFFRGSNMVSANNIDITVSAPTSVSGGEELVLEIEVSNRNAAALEGVNLMVEYPDGTRVAGNLGEELVRQRESLGVIGAHDKVQKTVRAVLFGEKDTIKTIKLTLEYRVEGSSATFSKEKNYDIGIKSSPLIVTPRYPTEINSNQEFEFILDIASNTGELLQDVLVVAEYPFGFTYKSSDPEPYFDTNVWSLGDVATGDRRSITIRGVIQGQNQEERTFRFNAGVASPASDREIGAVLTALAETIKIKRSEIALAVTIGGQVGEEYAAKLGERIPVSIVWTNNLPNKILNGRIEAHLSGSVLNRNSVIPGSGGFYRSSDNTIIWDTNSASHFSEIEPGDRGAVSFSFSPLETLPSSIGNQDIDISISFSASQIQPNNVPQAIAASTNRLVKIASEFGVTGRMVRTIGPFENSGPFPPAAEEETTYTVIWTATNSLNDVENVRVSAALPQYVKWNGLSNPSGAVSFDPVTHIVSWNAGTVRGGTGFGSDPREAAFQVTLLPSLSQVGTAPTVIGLTTIEAKDSFTDADLKFTRPALTTRIASDPDFEEDDARVVE